MILILLIGHITLAAASLLLVVVGLWLVFAGNPRGLSSKRVIQGGLYCMLGVVASGLVLGIAGGSIKSTCLTLSAYAAVYVLAAKGIDRLAAFTSADRNKTSS